MKLNQHLIMLEDFAFGTVFMAKAKRYVSCNEDTYFYVKHPDASTGLGGSPSKLLKNIKDQVDIFLFLEDFLKREGLYEDVKNGLTLLREKHVRVWIRNADYYSLNTKESNLLADLLEQMAPGYKAEPTNRDDNFFYRLHTPWDRRYEELKQLIIDPRIHYISFDIFDTLILRPFLRPLDLFCLLDSKFDDMMERIPMRTFSEIRVEAERIARKQQWKNHRYEDITLQEIYDILVTDYNVPEMIAKVLQGEEQQLEVKFCTARKKLKEIYDLAVFLGKTVIITTDMYLDRSTLEKILMKNGYTKYSALFISAEERLTKSSGHLYREVLDRLQIQPEEMLHIGDNWDSDISQARKLGINTCFVPKASDLLNNKIPDMKRKKCRAGFDAALYRLPTGNILKYSYAKEYLGIRCMLGTVANKIFDHPFLSYEPGTDFNRNPYYLGYFALGMHVFGIVQWLIQLCEKKGYQTIHFVARDGYTAMKVYEVVSKYYPNAPKINYFYMSRKSLLPLTISRAEDLFALPKFSPFKGKTPMDLIELIRPILDWKDGIEEEYWKRQILLDKPIEDEKEFRKFIKAVIDLSYSQQRNDAYRQQMRDYFSSQIGKNDVMFDIGYSGRAQAILSSLLGYGVNAAYIHYLDDQVYKYSQRFHFNVDCYYPHVPTVIGKLREILQSDTIGSCIGYQTENGVVTPILEKSLHTFHARFVIERAHQGAVDFAKELMENFSEFLPQLHYRDYELSFAHEYFLHYPTKGDMQMFSVVWFEDDVLHNKSFTARLTDLWLNDLRWYRLRGGTAPSVDGIDIAFAPGWKRTVYNAMFDRKSLKDDVKARLVNHRIIHDILKFGYCTMRSSYKSLRQLRNHKLMDTKKPDIKAKTSQHLHISSKIDGKGKILYSATSEYGILCCLVHKLTYFQEQDAVLLVSEWRKQRVPVLENSNIFSEVYVFCDKYLRQISSDMDAALENAGEGAYAHYAKKFLLSYDEKFPFNITSFSKIIVHNTAMPLGSYLESRNIHYEAFEDAGGIFSVPLLLKENIEKTYPKVEQWLIEHYKVLNEAPNCNKWYINYSAQKSKFKYEKTEDFNPIVLLDKMSVVNRNKILRIFGIITQEVSGKDQRANLILTYPLSVRLGIQQDEQRLIYATLADLFLKDEQPIYLKPHPDDHVNYELLTNMNIVPPLVLSELLKYEVGVPFYCAISAVSTALNSLNDIERKLYFDKELIEHRHELLQYYVASQYIKEKCSKDVIILGKGCYHQLLQYLLEDRTYRSLENNWDNKNIDLPRVFILGDENEENIDQLKSLLSTKDIVISLFKWEGADVLEISKQKAEGAYMGELQQEYLYISRAEKNSIKNDSFSLEMYLRTLNIKLSVKKKTT